ncbi:MAG: molybdopterin-dependent oxidoreductase [Spirochaetia bacterium]|nr:molybdopterin-dependent oxidoreductase [Spirochaetia bacterium]
MSKTFSVVNHSVAKIDALALIQGKPAYTDDLAPADALVVKLLRSPHAFARIVSIDKSQALALEGVACVLDWRDVPRIPYTRAGQGHPEPSPHDRFILDRIVRFVGDEVAVVAAEDETIADTALSLIKVEYEILEPLLDFETAADNPRVIHPEPEIHDMFPIGFEPKRNIAASYSMELGDLEGALASSDLVLSRSFKTQSQAHVAMEPHAAFAYLDLHQRLVVCTSTQNPFHTRRLLGQALRLPLSRIRVLKPRIGGGFGGKQQIHVEPFVSLVCLATGRAARCTLSRREVFEATFCRHEMRIDMRIGSDKTGKIRAIDMQVLSNTGAYGEHALTVFMVGGSKTLPLYNKIKAVRFGGKVVYTNTRSAGAFRGYGAIQGNFALESMIDELAHALVMDPIQLRNLNMVREGESSDVYRVMGEGREGVDMIFESCKLEYCVARGRELIGWDDGPLAREIAPGRIRAKGMAIAMQGSGIPLVDMGSASIELQDGGCFKLRIGATDLGTGSDTILAQIAAEELGVPLSSINVYASDTDHTPFDVGAYASSTTYVSGNAVLAAAKKMKSVLIDAVAQRHSLSADDVRFYKQKFYKTDGSELQDLESLSLDTLYHDGEKMATLNATASFSGPKSPPPYVAGFAEIELDTGTGKVDIVQYIAVVDCGVAINPALARIQVEGGIAQGIGMALFENVIYDTKGRLMTNSLRNYTIPSRKDIGAIVVEFADSFEPSGPFGAKSVAEVSIDSPPAAIANAVFNAAGIRLTQTPFTPERVLKALQEK